MKFKRSLSSANPDKAWLLREKIRKDVSPKSGKPRYLLRMAIFSFWLFSFAMFPQEYHKALEEALIENALTESLERTKVLNWCRTIKRLYPLVTLGDGNCLLHSVSLALWGCTDSNLFLRRLMYVSLSERNVNFRLRWRRERKKIDAEVPDDFVLNNVDWDREWENVVESTNPDQQRTPNELPFDCLEEIHIFALANILRRPIIVLAENVARGLQGEPLAPNNFSGIYLPLEWDPKECIKYPICLGFDGVHFSPLVSMKDGQDSEILAVDSLHGIPLVNHEFVPLQMHFVSEDEDKGANHLLSQYMHIDETPLSSYDGTNMVLFAKLAERRLESDFNLSEDYIQDCFAMIDNQPAPLPSGQDANGRSIPSAPLASNISCGGIIEPSIEAPQPLVLEEEVPVRARPPAIPPVANAVKDMSISGERCVSKNCTYYSSVKTYPYCHRCHKKKDRKRDLDRQLSNSVPYEGKNERQQHFTSLEHYKADEEQGKLCNMSGCDLYGRAEWAWYCSLHKNHHVEPPQQQPPPAVEGMSLIGHRQVTMESSASPQKKKRGPQRCKTSGCREDVNPRFQGLCSDCYLQQSAGSTRSPGTNSASAEEQQGATAGTASSVSNACKKPGCSYSGTAEQQGYCSQHYKEEVCGEENVAALSTTNILDRLPAQSHAQRAQAHSLYKCATQDCCRIANMSSESRGYCYRCYVDQVRHRQIPLQPKKMKCTTEGCNNVCLENSLGLCNGCLENVQRKPLPRARRPASNESNPESLIESMAGVPQVCKKSHCQNPREGNMNGMCTKCYTEFLQDLQDLQSPTMLAKKQQKVFPTSQPQAKLCKNPGCTRFGDPAFKGLCSYCHRPPTGEAARPKYPVTYQQQIPQPRPQADPFQLNMQRKENEARRSGKCRNPTCANYANSRCHGYCNSCYPLFAREVLTSR